MADSGTYTPEAIKRRFLIAQQLMDQSKQKPITHWAEGLNEIAKGALGGYQFGQAEKAERQGQADAIAQAVAALGGGSAPLAPPAVPAGVSGVAQALNSSAPSASPVTAQEMPSQNQFNSIDAMASPAGKFDPSYQDTLGRAGQAVAGIESGGRYDKLGPIIEPGRKLAGDRAYGKYQVMGTNVGPWTKDVLGEQMTPQQFLQNPDAQDTVFNAKFGADMQKYGNVTDPASKWFSGRPLAEAGGGDQLGTTVPGYANKVALALNGPAQVAGPPSAAAPPAGAPAPAQAGNSRAAIAAILNPYTPPAVAHALVQQLNPSFGFQTLPDGTILRTNPKNGTVEPIYSAPVKPELKETGSDPITGQKSFQVFDPKTQTMRPVQGPAGSPAQSESGFLAPGVKSLDHSLSGDDYLKQFGPEVQAAVKAYIAGDVMPSGNPRMQSLANTAKTIAQKYGQDMGIPVSDATYSQRRTYRSQLGSNSPSSAGGQAKAFNQGIEHMGHLADTLEKLDNSNGLGIPIVASAINAGRQGISTEQSAISDKASSIGQTLAGEVGKLFSGTAGGGVHERELTRERFSTVKSKPQLAAALEGTLEMMRGGLTALEQRRDEVMGSNSGIRFINPETEAKIATIQSTIDRLKSGAKAAAPSGVDPAALVEAKKRGLVP